jgi:hypothetical protein
MMEPFHFDDYSIPSKISRDPLTIYPLFMIYFYFNDRPDGSKGLVLFVWGDTGEIRSCQEVGKGFYYNGPIYETNSLLQDEQPLDPQEQYPPDEPNAEETTQPADLNPLNLAVVASLVAVPVIAISVLAIRHKKINNK